MAYYRECPRCGAALDPGEACACDSAHGARLPAVRPPAPERIEVQASRKAMEYAMDRMIYDAYCRRVEARAARRRKVR